MTTQAATDREIEDFTDALDSAPESEAVSEQRQLLLKLVERIGSRLLNETDWQRLLAIPHTTLIHAESTRTLNRTFRDNYRGRRAGFSAADVLAWIRKCEIDYSITPVAEAMIGATAADAINPEITYNAELVDARLGIPLEVTKKACHVGKLHHVGRPKEHLHSGYLPGKALVDWIERERVPLSLSVDVAAQLAYSRSIAPLTSDEPADHSPNVVNDALSRVEAAKRENAAVENAERDEMLRSYREIIRRVSAPQSGDAELLAELCERLSIDRERIEEDIAILAEAAELRALQATIENARREVADAAAAMTTLDQEYKQKHEQARIRKGSAFAAHRAAQEAPAKLHELQRRRPELFD